MFAPDRKIMSELVTIEDIYKLFEKTNEKFEQSQREWDRRFQESRQEADRQTEELKRSLAKLEKSVDCTTKAVDSLTTRWGRFVEELVEPAVIKLFQVNGIDSCFGQNPELINDLINSKDNYLSDDEIKLMITQALQPLLNRIKILEQKLQDYHNNDSENIAQNQDYFNQSEAENLEANLSINTTNQEEERTYLPRHQIWQMLKQTDYVKFCGYDSFLAATPDEFIDYGIFFDRDKKRYYIKS